jgi:hypothetical protein
MVRCGSNSLEPLGGSEIFGTAPQFRGSDQRFYKQGKHRKLRDMHILCRIWLYFWVICVQLRLNYRGKCGRRTLSKNKDKSFVLISAVAKVFHI